MNAISGDFAIAKSIAEGPKIPETPPLSRVVRQIKGTRQGKCSAASKIVQEAFESQSARGR